MIFKTLERSPLESVPEKKRESLVEEDESA